MYQNTHKADGDSYSDEEIVSGETLSSTLNSSAPEKDCETSDNPEGVDSDTDEIELEMKKMKLRQMRLEIDREELKLEQDRIYAQIAHEKEILSLETDKGRAQFQLSYYKTQQDRYWKDLFDEKRSRRRQERVYFSFRMVVSLLLVIAGLWLLSRGDSLGAYLLGTGAGSVGLHSASNVFGNNTQNIRKESHESTDVDKSLPRLNGGS